MRRRRACWPISRSFSKAVARDPRAWSRAVDQRSLWALGRLGARQPFHGTTHAVVAAEVATRWVEALMALDWKRQPGAAFAAAHLARLTGDRARDLDAGLRERVAQRLAGMKIAPAWAAMLREVVVLDEAAERQVFGEALPPGLKLIG